MSARPVKNQLDNFFDDIDDLSNILINMQKNGDLWIEYMKNDEPDPNKAFEALRIYISDLKVIQKEFEKAFYNIEKYSYS